MTALQQEILAILSAYTLKMDEASHELIFSLDQSKVKEFVIASGKAFQEAATKLNELIEAREKVCS
jgi:hypothetical protein